MPKKILVPEGMKWCGQCQQTLPLEQFHRRGGNRKDYDGKCKKCRLSKIQVAQNYSITQ